MCLCKEDKSRNQIGSSYDLYCTFESKPSLWVYLPEYDRIEKLCDFLDTMFIL